MRDKYTSIGGCGIALSNPAVMQAWGMLEFDRPCLHIHPVQYGYADHLATEMRLNIEVDIDLKPFEWYITWRGKSFGSEGA